MRQIDRLNSREPPSVFYQSGKYRLKQNPTPLVSVIAHGDGDLRCAALEYSQLETLCQVFIDWKFYARPYSPKNGPNDTLARKSLTRPAPRLHRQHLWHRNKGHGTKRNSGTKVLFKFERASYQKSGPIIVFLYALTLQSRRFPLGSGRETH